MRHPRLRSHIPRLRARLLRFLSIGFAALLCLGAAHTVVAGGGPTGVVVVYNPTDPSAVTVANYYQRVRGIPERNMIPYAFPANSTSTFPSRTSAWDFIYTLRSELTNRGLEDQLQAVALLGVVPKLAAQQSVVAFGSGAGVSFPAFIYLSPGYGQASFPTTVGDTYGGPRNAAYPDDSDFFGPAPKGTRAITATTDLQGQRPHPWARRGYTGRSGLAMNEWFAVIDRARARDGTRPDGTIYWPLNSDLRSSLRQPQIGVVGPIWKERGIRYEVVGSSGSTIDRWVQNRPDVVGGIVGQRNATTPAGIRGGNTIRAGWIDNLTSIGGYIDFFVIQDTQMSLAKWLRAGADGASGSAYEPGGTPVKFPHAHIHTHFRAGASLAEAYWQSIEYPSEIFPMGDPLAQPWASLPSVTISAPANDAVVSGILSIEATASATGGRTLEPLLDLFIDGRRVNIGAAGETIAAARTATGFSLNTATLTDGWHDVRVVAYNDDSVRTQAEARITIRVNNAGQSITLTGPATVNPASTAAFTANLTGLAGLTSLTLRANGRTLANFPVSGGAVNVALNAAASFAPFSGDWTLFAVGTLASGQQVSSAPLTVTPDWLLLPALPNPSLGAASADVRYFADTIAAGFDWNTAAPTATGRITGDTNTGIFLAVDAVPNDSSTTTDQMTIGGTAYTLTYANRPGFQVDFWFYAPADGTYEFAHDFSERVFFPTSRSERREFYIDDQLVTERDFLIEPRRLAAGWHKVRARFVVNSGSTFNASGTQVTAGWASWKARVRGVTNVDFGIIMPAMAASFGSGVAADVPTIASVTGNTTPITGTTRQLTATASIASGTLTYHWARLTGGTHGGVHAGPSINTTFYEPLVIAFSANGTSTANAPTLTFNEPGSYLVGLRVAGPNASAYQTIPLTVAATASGTLFITPTASPGADFATVGEPYGVAACTRDQFGRRIPITATNPSQPTVQWSSTDPLGTFELTSADGESARFRAGTGSTTGQLHTITATGVNGRSGTASTNVTIFPGPTLSGSALYLFSIAQDAGTRRFTFTAAVNGAPTAIRQPPVTYAWNIVGTPAGQTLELESNGLATVKATASGPGTYLVQLTVTANGGSTLSETRSFTVDAAGVGAFLENPPATPSLPVNVAAPVYVGDVVSLSRNFTDAAPGLTYQWQTSNNGGASWQNIPGTTERNGSTTTTSAKFGPVTAADNNRLFRLQIINATGTASGAPGTLTVTNPASGVIHIAEGFDGSIGREVSEAAGSVTFTLRRVGSSSGAASVRWDLMQESATQGADYLGNNGSATYSGTLSWASGDSADKIVTVPLVNDSLLEGRERFYLFTSSVTGAALGSSSYYEYWIVDDDGPGRAAFIASHTEVKESDGQVQLTVRRAPPYNGALSVTYATAPGSAASGDFTATSGTLQWANGESADKTIVIPITSDTSVEGDETFTVELSAANARLLGAPGIATVTVKDAPFQQWQRQWWPSLLPVTTLYPDFPSAVRGLRPWLYFRFAETAGTTVAGTDATGATLVTATLGNTGAGSSALNIAGPRATAWPGLESTNTGNTFTASGSAGSPAAYNAGSSLNAGAAAGLARRLGMIPLGPSAIAWATPPVSFSFDVTVPLQNIWDGSAATASDPTKLRAGMAVLSPDFLPGTGIRTATTDGLLTMRSLPVTPLTAQGITATSGTGLTISAFVRTTDTSRVMAILGGQNAVTVSLTDGTTNATTTVTCASTTGLAPGMAITGTGIPANTRINQVVNATTLVISAAATTGNNGLTFTATDTTTLQVTLNQNAVSTGTITPDHLRIFLRSAAGRTFDYSVPLSGLPTGKITDGQWHHIAITIPPFYTPPVLSDPPNNDSNQPPRFYFDGAEANPLLARGTENLSAVDIFFDFVNGLRIGAAGTVNPATFFNGSLDEVAFFPRTLTPAEISVLANARPAAAVPASITDTANPASDGIDNLTKYALGLNPLLPYPPGTLPALGRSGTFSQFSFTRMRDATDITYRLERSPDLAPLSWQEIWNSTGDPYPGATPSITETIARDEGLLDRAFYRLRITRP